MQATYKGKNIVYNIEDNSYSDGFSTTFRQDFLIASMFGSKSIQDTYNRASKEWLTSVRYFTDLTMALNHLANYYYSTGNLAYSELYGKLYYKALDLGYKTFKNEDLHYFIGILD